ncbi:MAG: hypothetical protein ACK5RG_02460 [Cyclobacteriaceae bacterium]|jgi:hypothetical protein|nr:hypothetical protein [Flammeovirgaceae bacterium]
MKRKLKTIALCILIIHISLYSLIGDWVLEKMVFNEFREFCVRKNKNPYNVKHTSEQFLFLSCGDEFFRDRSKLKEYVNKYDLDYCNEKIDTSCYGLFRNIEFANSNTPFTELIKNNIDSLNQTTCIPFKACRVKSIPLLWTSVEVDAAFSVHSDFHSMIHNDQTISKEIQYVWLIFGWLPISEKEN